MNKRGKGLAESVPTEVPYDNTHLNNSNSAPLWPKPRNSNETMFIVPRGLKSGDKINVTGFMNSNPRILVAGLVTGDSTPDYDNVACQVETVFPEKFTVKYTKNGKDNIVDGAYTDLTANELITDQFDFQFIFSGEYLIVKVNNMDLQYMPLKHSLNKIKFISLSGDIRNISSLEFKFEN